VCEKRNGGGWGESREGSPCPTFQILLAAGKGERIKRESGVAFLTSTPGRPILNEPEEGLSGVRAGTLLLNNNYDYERREGVNWITKLKFET